MSNSCIPSCCPMILSDFLERVTEFEYGEQKMTSGGGVEVGNSGCESLHRLVRTQAKDRREKSQRHQEHYLSDERPHIMD